jgi:hypothetical protein
MERISRTIGRDQLTEELVMSFTHDIAMNYLLLGVPPPVKGYGWRSACWLASGTASSAMSTFTGIRLPC